MDQLRIAFLNAKLTPDAVAWYERETGKKMAPLPKCKLRRLAAKAGFTSSKDFLDAERRKRHAR